MANNCQKLLLIFLANLLIYSCLADEQQERKKFQQLGTKIQALQKSIQHSSKELQTLNSQLQENEVRVTRLQKEINQIASSIGKINRELKQLWSRRGELTTAKEQQKLVIVAEINTSYRLGKEPTLKLLLNQEDPEKISRVLKYHDYFLEARAAKLATYIETLHSLEEVESNINTNKKHLVENRLRLSQQKEALLDQQQKRRQVLAKLQQSIKTDDQRLNQLLVERKRLEAVIKELGEAISSINLPTSLQPFHKQKGKMAWPTKGKLKHRFGSRRNTRIKWDGWLITAPEGTSVKAIHHGRVVFADYLRGQGMLIIIDHGDGYMSLYAHNQVVLKETGDWVQQGETIARVGNTGGRLDTALYFEIRHNGQPTNPGSWLGRT